MGKGTATFVVVVNFILFVLRNFIRKRPSPYAGNRQSDTTEAAGHTRAHVVLILGELLRGGGHLVTTGAEQFKLLPILIKFVFLGTSILSYQAF